MIEGYGTIFWEIEDELDLTKGQAPSGLAGEPAEPPSENDVPGEPEPESPGLS